MQLSLIIKLQTNMLISLINLLALDISCDLIKLPLFKFAFKSAAMFVKHNCHQNVKTIMIAPSAHREMYFKITINSNY